MKIFLTGSTGYLGSNIKKDIPAEYFCYTRGDDIINDLWNFKPDCIIHSAAEIYDVTKMFNSNVLLTQQILSYMTSHDIKMIYIGSSSEYGKVDTPMSERTLPDPYSIYAATKTCGTLLCQAYAREYNRDICIVRPFSVYGSNEPQRRLIPTLYRNILEGKKTVMIRGSHDFVYIKDFIRLIQIILNSTSTKDNIINCGTGKSYLNYEVYELMRDIMKKECEVEMHDIIKPQDSEIWKCDIRSAHIKYGFLYQYEFKDGLKEYINERLTT
jgi:nucleoside-diphosphate-sugar epimerase